MLLNTYNYHCTAAHFIFSIFVSMSRPRSIYVFILSLILIIINHITSLKQLHLLFVHFLKCLLLFLDDIVNENGHNFQIVKVQPQGVD